MVVWRSARPEGLVPQVLRETHFRARKEIDKVCLCLSASMVNAVFSTKLLFVLVRIHR